MAGESLVKDLAEVLEFYGIDERLQLPSRIVAKYLLRGLDALYGLKAEWPTMEVATSSDARPTSADASQATGSATNSLFDGETPDAV